MNEVVFVGTSDAFGSGGRRQSAVLVRGSRGTGLLDCGATTNTGLRELGIDRNEIDAILVSHFHGDHFGGIPLFVLAAVYQDQRREPLEIAGPPQIEARVRALATAMGHPLEDLDCPFPLRFSELQPGVEQAVGPGIVSAFETRHQPEAHPHGYRLSLGERDVVYSGDTGWFDELPRLASGADLFICECTLHTECLDFHLNLGQITEHRDEFDVGGLLLTHLGQEMAALRGQCELDTADDGLIVKL
jgi:ribonuclease BN (tRNA processing enzyme)